MVHLLLEVLILLPFRHRPKRKKKEIIFFERQLGDLKFFVIIFNKFDLLVLFLKSFPEEINILIDNDFGKFFTREQATEFKSYDEFTS